jgi:hypothetical protein
LILLNNTANRKETNVFFAYFEQKRFLAHA